MKGIKNILIGILIVLALLQFVQFALKIIPVRPLAGVVEEKAWPGFSVETISSGAFQDYVSDYAGYHFGFRPWFVRLNNQFYYSLFHKSPYANLVIGKKRYLFEKPYIESFYGETFIGNDAADSTLLKLTAVQTFLKHQGVELVIVVTPNKADYFSEYIPDHLTRNKETTNYDYFSKKLQEAHFNVLDANAWFKAIKTESEYPLMTRTGIHWSIYGSTFFADSLVSYIEQKLGREMVHFVVDSIEYPCTPRDTDKDLEDLANIFSRDGSSIYAYPYSYVHEENEDGFKPDMVVIGDSFFWNFYQGYFTICFDEIHFWYYFHSIFPPLPQKIATTDEIDIVQQTLNKDVLLLVTSTDNLKDFGFGFIEYMHEYLQMDSLQKYNHLIPRYVKSINNDPELMESARAKAAERNISIDSMIYLDACWLAGKHLEEIGDAVEN